MELFQQLSSTDLSALALALRSGRLESPYSEIAIQRFYAGSEVAQITRGFQRLAEEGMSSHHVALVLESILTTRDRQKVAEEPVELVWTGPESGRVSNRDTSVVVRDLFESAVHEILIVGFVVYQGKEIFRRLAERMVEMPELKVKFCLDIQRRHGDTTTASELVWQFVNRFRLHEWPGSKLPELYYDPRSLDLMQEKRSSLHAKCIVVDRRISFIGSANFTEAAQNRNIEVGALIRSIAFSENLVNHFSNLIASGHLIPLPQ